MHSLLLLLDLKYMEQSANTFCDRLLSYIADDRSFKTYTKPTRTSTDQSHGIVDFEHLITQ